MKTYQLIAFTDRLRASQSFANHKTAIAELIQRLKHHSEEPGVNELIKTLRSLLVNNDETSLVINADPFTSKLEFRPKDSFYHVIVRIPHGEQIYLTTTDVVE